MSNNLWSRREFVKRAGTTAGTVAVGFGLADLLAACGSTSAPAATGTGNLEIFSWWTGPGEKEGLAQLFNFYKQKYPNVTIVNQAVAGGAGSNAKAVLATRMQGGQPPDSFQVHAGQELISTWVKASKMEPITSIWNAAGWDSVVPKDLKDIVSSGGDIWSVPVNVHRGNALWYNKKLLDSKSVNPPTTPDEFTSALSTLKSKGIATPLALASKGNWQVPGGGRRRFLQERHERKGVLYGRTGQAGPRLDQDLAQVREHRQLGDRLGRGGQPHHLGKGRLPGHGRLGEG
ncbi:MAG: carbohydrate ABC transporter substrate-binding protein [Chloroflexi bacterium]|nr:MAG: carbohydrate ABC transporter substrate-binding protein [Chloroflexota bacterium]